MFRGPGVKGVACSTPENHKTMINRTCFAFAGLALATFVTFTSLAGDAAKPAESRKLLAKHQTVARFEGISYHKCMGMTALCPDRCGHSGDQATFSIVKYLAYEKPGQYGEPREARFSFLVQDNMKNMKVPDEIKRTLDSLRPGDYVLLDWRHDYVSREGANFPERPIENLKPISKEEADKLPPMADAAANK
jgi:hypothetical protein